ncbi:FAD-dependent oxidoreductase [Arthrobacter sp. BE255]|uniref:NAD(P)/FAD-dependent oxidoreductase n=1 Tax=Arthrobacter sp. BE255 TaxID=2817721 RepID=UPI002863613C|nr:FAD-dependent oxidoreductase [Arthrobacter sp. BE255]MDR7159763.1 3-phenylpropionate/trans-cinnamate dioxygenase ferredoxin reductase subunit [Arthrobacter sp. BE255]
MNVVIIGGGQAGLQVADTLRTEGYDGKIDVIAEEPGLPYQRPPLSKDYLAPDKEAAPLPLRGPTFFTDKNITLHEGVQAIAINRAERKVKTTEDSLGYDHLIFATGARNRMLNCPGASLPGIHGLKTLTDAEALHVALPPARNIVIIGAGFIGLEFAAAALAHGCNVTVLEFAPRPMGRALTPVMSEWFADALRSQGVNLRLSEGIDRFEPGAGGRVGAAISTTGASYPADLVLVGIGVQPNDTLAAEAGLETSNGIVVDETLRTADPAVLAIGDCASFPSAHAQGRLRLESVQNATDQARHAARTILGAESPYTDLPWFWSTQGPYKLQMAGLARPDDDMLILGDQGAAKFSVLCFRDGILAAVESVNSAADHMAARKLLAAGTAITRTQAESEGFTLKAAASSPVIPVSV